MVDGIPEGHVFPDFIDDVIREARSNNLNTGIIVPEDYVPGEEDYIYNQWRTIVNKAYEDKNNNGLPDNAFLNLDPTPHNAADDYLYVRYPDGLYILAAYAEDVNRDPTHAHLSLDINRNKEMDEDEWQQARTVVIDNFIPYLKEVKIT